MEHIIMAKSLFEYSQLPKLDDAVRDNHHKKILEKMLDNPEAFKYDIEEMIDCFLTELGNADFIRLYDKVMEKK